MKTIGIIAPSGGVDEIKMNNAIAFFENKGYKVKLAKNIFDKKRYLAGSDKDKVDELHNFFEDSEIDMIISARGGYGAIRLVNQIDYDLIKNNPKPFIGFSDVTALLLMIYKKTGITTYHGPMACSDFGDFIPYPNPLLQGEGMMFSWNNLIKAINDEKLEFDGNKIYREGEARGIIWGGNLATVVSLCGLDFIPSKDFIFFAEDLNEPVYKIDKMFQQLININQFKNNCKAIVLGDFLNVDNREWLEEYFYELANRLEIPVVAGFKITHDRDKITVPIGKESVLDGENLFIF